MTGKETVNRPPVIVFNSGVTGMATARALTDYGVDVHVASFLSSDACNYTRRCKVINLADIKGNQPLICEWLCDYAGKLGNRPIVIPTSDSLALMMTKNRSMLEPVCQFWNTSYEQLHSIISKEKLYIIAIEAGLKVPPMTIEPGVDDLKSWCINNAPPYFIKPYYEGIAECALKDKNEIFQSSEDLIEYVNKRGASALIVQRCIQGGDGWVFDCYGLCGSNSKIITLASHKRIRQYPADRGITCYGEIPGIPEGLREEDLFKSTTSLLSHLNYHGIFGIEWMQDCKTGELYLIDFNARPFSSIGHLKDCGMNLPWLAYQEICGQDMSQLTLTPTLKHKYWIDFMLDMGTFRYLRNSGKIKWYDWLRSILRCRSFAYWNLSDPWPGLLRLDQLLRYFMNFIFKKV